MPRYVTEDGGPGPVVPDRSGLHIAVVAGTGCGRTPLSAFDAALWQCGLHDYNLLPLSSVIPPASVVARAERYEASGAVGDKLYVVKAEARATRPGVVIGAGLGWLQWGDDGGVFVEHEARAVGVSDAALRARLQRQIQASLCDLAAMRGLDGREARTATLLSTTRVVHHPACALVVAIYQAEGWRRDEPPAAERVRW